jgi:HK97 family phage prohead protease
MNRSQRLETREHFAEIRAASVGGEPGVTLHCIRPGVVDDYGSLWNPAAFDASLAERMPTLCWGHSWLDPLGPPRSFRTSADGPDVDFVFSDFDAVPSARRAYAQVQDGTIEDCSVGFSNVRRRDPTDAEIAQYPGVREVIEEATLDEVSLVLRGAVPGAKVLAVRSQPDETVPEDDVVSLARKVNAGEVSFDDARTALALLATEARVLDPAVDPDEDTAQLALAVDAALDSAIGCAEGVDMTTWPAEAQQMFGCVVAAETAVDALLEQMGVADPDDADTPDVPVVTQLDAPEPEQREPEPDGAELEALVARATARSR